MQEILKILPKSTTPAISGGIFLDLLLKHSPSSWTGMSAPVARSYRLDRLATIQNTLHQSAVVKHYLSTQLLYSFCTTMAPWLRVLEAYLVQALLRTPAFHRGVEKVAHRVHRLRNGLPPEPKGGTSVDDPANSNFLKHFSEEVQTQLGRAERRSEWEATRPARRSVPEEGENADAAWKAVEEERAGKAPKERRMEAEEGGEDAEGAWRSAGKRGLGDGEGAGPKQGFLGEYMAALREQMRNGK